MPRLLTPEEAACLLQMKNAKTLVKWAREGTGNIPAHFLGEGKRRLCRFFEHELIAWVESKRSGRVPSNGRH